MADFEEQMMNKLSLADRTAANQQSIEVNIPFDILSQIFLNLPFKSIIRCMSVCKPWRQLISHPDFVKLHLARSNNLNQILIRSDDPSFYSIDCQQPFGQANPQTLARNLPLPQYEAEIFGSCNGLFCLYVRTEEEAPLDIVLWNPSIGDYKILPDPYPYHKFLYRGGVMLGGLGYDPYSDDYMIVRELFQYWKQSPIIQQPCGYSLKTNSWRVVETPTLCELGFTRKWYVEIKAQSVGTCINGAIYWLLCHEYNSNCDMHDRWIVGFNLKDEIFFNLSLWEDHRSRICYDTNILAIEKSLGVCFTGRESIGIWIMEQKNHRWTNLYRIPLSAIFGDVQEAISMYRNREIEWTAVRVFENGKIVFYSGNHYHGRFELIKKLSGPAVYDTKAESGDTKLNSKLLLDNYCYQRVSYA